jgi:hypothetical protein
MWLLDMVARLEVDCRGFGLESDCAEDESMVIGLRRKDNE